MSRRRSVRLSEKKQNLFHNQSSHPLIKNLLSTKTGSTPQDCYLKTTKIHNGKFSNVRIIENYIYTPNSQPFKVFTANSSPVQNLRYSPTKQPLKVKNIALKTQIIRNPTDIDDMTYHEVIVHKILNNISNCNGFTKLLTWYKTKDLKCWYMNFVLENGGNNLETFFSFLTKNIKINTVKSVLFQLFYTIYVAQKEYEFVHNDLHFKNILINKNSLVTGGNKKCVYMFKINGICFYTEDLLVKITDFGHARVKFEDNVIYNKKNPVSHMFNPVTDLMKIKDGFCGRRNNLRNWLFCDEQEIKLKRKLFKDIEVNVSRTSHIFYVLLQHDFFKSLRNKPVDCLVKNCGEFFYKEEKYVPRVVKKEVFEIRRRKSKKRKKKKKNTV